jgi:hypothetical protein
MVYIQLDNCSWHACMWKMRTRRLSGLKVEPRRHPTEVSHASVFRSACRSPVLSHFALMRSALSLGLACTHTGPVCTSYLACPVYPAVHVTTGEIPSPQAHLSTLATSAVPKVVHLNDSTNASNCNGVRLSCCRLPHRVSLGDWDTSPRHQTGCSQIDLRAE